MRNLTEYVNRANQWDLIFKKAPTFTFPLTQKMVDRIVDKLNGDLSPENLHCDGEISAAEAQRKYKFFTRVADELAVYAMEEGLRMGQVYEL